jgi:hypothetical protein
MGHNPYHQYPTRTTAAERRCTSKDHKDEHLPPSSTPHLPVPIEIAPFSFQEIAQALAFFKKAKATGPDRIPLDLLKLLDTTNLLIVLEASNDAHIKGELPTSWTLAKMICLFKKEDSSLPEDYQPFSLLDAFYKLYARVILNRIQVPVDQQFRKTQYGFRAARSKTRRGHPQHSFTYETRCDLEYADESPCSMQNCPRYRPSFVLSARQHPGTAFR